MNQGNQYPNSGYFKFAIDVNSTPNILYLKNQFTNN